jgi:hypothetical protein
VLVTISVWMTRVAGRTIWTLRCCHAGVIAGPELKPRRQQSTMRVSGLSKEVPPPPRGP